MKQLFLTTVLASFGVFSQWSYWSVGQYALGFNSLFFWCGFSYWLFTQKSNHKSTLKHDWPWVTPLVMMILSFALFENAWVKAITVFILPISFGLFYAYGQLNQKATYEWDAPLLHYLASRVASALSSPDQDLLSSPNCTHHLQQWPIKRIIIALLILTPLALIVSLTLTTADANFSHLLEGIFDAIGQYLGWDLLFQLYAILVVTLLLLSIATKWTQPLCTESA